MATPHSLSTSDHGHEGLVIENSQAEGSAPFTHMIYFVRLKAKKPESHKFDRFADYVFSRPLAAKSVNDQDGEVSEQKSASEPLFVPAIGCLFYKSTHNMDWIPLTEKMLEIQSAQQTFPIITRIGDQHADILVTKIPVIEAFVEAIAACDDPS